MKKDKKMIGLQVTALYLLVVTIYCIARCPEMIPFMYLLVIMVAVFVS